jgi:hypothetical protein
MFRPELPDRRTCAGIDTIGSTLKIANLDLQHPQTRKSDLIWNQSSVEDLNRRPLEIDGS